MVCLIQYLYWECWKGKKQLECKGKDCRWYGSDTCWAKDGDRHD